MILSLVFLVAQAAVPFTLIARGSTSSIDTARTVVVQSAEDWRKLWVDHQPDRPAPDVDFAGSTVLAVFAGTRPTAGYSVTISKVTAAGGRLIVEFTERAPGPDMMTAQTLTAPFHIVRVAKQSGPVEFRAVKP